MRKFLNETAEVGTSSGVETDTEKKEEGVADETPDTNNPDNQDNGTEQNSAAGDEGAEAE